MRSVMGEINAPVLIERLTSIHEFYDKIAKLNPEASARDILDFIKKFPDVCVQTLDDFEENLAKNLLLTAYPFALKGETYETLKGELDTVDEILAGKYKNEAWEPKAAKRKELTNILLDQLSFDLSKITIKGL